MEHGGGESGLPVVRVDDVGREAGNQSAGDRGGTLGERGKPQCVVGPGLGIGIDIRIAGPGKQVRRVEHEKVESRRACSDQARGPTLQAREVVHGIGRAERVDHAGIAGHQSARRDAFAGQGEWQRRDNVGETAGLDQRVDLRRHGQDVHALHRGPLALGCIVKSP